MPTGCPREIHGHPMGDTWTPMDAHGRPWMPTGNPWAISSIRRKRTGAIVTQTTWTIESWTLEGRAISCSTRGTNIVPNYGRPCRRLQCPRPGGGVFYALRRQSHPLLAFESPNPPRRAPQCPRPRHVEHGPARSGPSFSS